jgi:hypothetical protein
MTYAECRRYWDLFDDFLNSELLVETSQEILHHLGGCEECRAEFERRQALRRLLNTSLQVDAPAGLATGIAARLAAAEKGGTDDAAREPGDQAEARDRGRWWKRKTDRPARLALPESVPFHTRSSLALLLSRRLRATVLLAALAFGAVLVVVLTGPGRTQLSAAEVVRRADARLADLVKPGQVLYRRWHVDASIRRADGTSVAFEQRYEEWAEGAVPNRLTVRSHVGDGRLIGAVWTVLENGTLRASTFLDGSLAAEYVGGAGGSVPDFVLAWPTRAELDRAAADLPASERRLLDLPLAVMEPVVADRSTLESVRHGDIHDVRVEHTTLRDGRPGICLTIVRERCPLFDWTARPIRVIPVRTRLQTTYSADTYLGDVLERETTASDGRRIADTFRLEDLRVLDAAEVPGVFSFSPPPGTVTMHLSATDLVQAYRQAIIADRPTDMFRSAQPH